MFVEQDDSESIVLAATNHPELLDRALYRRFDDIIPFTRPEDNLISNLIEQRLAVFDLGNLFWSEIIDSASGLSAAEITRASEDAAKESVLYNANNITTDLLVKAIKRRQESRQ